MATNFAKVFPRKARREFVIGFLGRSIQKAHMVNPSSWALCDHEYRTDLHVGQLGPIYISDNRVAIMVDGACIKKQEVESLGGNVLEEVKWVPNSLWIEFEGPRMEEQLSAVEAAHLSLVHAAARKQRIVRAQVRKDHSPELIKYLQSKGPKLAQPAYWRE
jgi:hypothetical protein